MRNRATSGVLILASAALLGLDWPGEGAARASEFAHANALRRVELLHLLAPSSEPEARAALAAALGDPELIVRETARQLAVQHPSEELVPALLRVLDEANVAARTDALDALAGIRSADARRAIERAVSDRNATIRAHAVLALSSVGADAVVALLDRVHDPEGDVRAAAADALGRIGDPRAALALVGISQDPIPEVRLAAARALGSLPGEVAARALLGLVHDAMPDVRLAALHGLQEHPDPAMIPTLASLARPDLATSLAGRDVLARAAIAALGHIDSPDARRALLDVALDPRAARAREAIAALAAHPERLRDESSAILPRLTRDNVELFADLLGRIGGDEVADVMLDLLGSTDSGSIPTGATPGLSAALLRGLGRSGSDRALQTLLERLTTAPAATAEHRVGGCARGAIEPALLDAIALWAETRHGLDPLAIDPLVEALPRLDLACHAQLAMLLGLLGLTGNDRAAPTLITALHHPDAVIRTAAARGLGRAVSPTALAPLIGAMSDHEGGVRAAAAASLRAMPGGALVVGLAARWRDPAPVDRSLLLLALGHALATPELPPGVRAPHLPMLLTAAAAGPWRTRAAAVRALGSVAMIGDPQALRSLASSAAITADPRVAMVAMEALGNLGVTSQTPERRLTIAAQLDGSRAPTMRAAAAWALRSVGPISLDLLLPLIDDATSPVAVNALAALARMDFGVLDAAARERLRARVEHIRDSRVRPTPRGNACAVLLLVGGTCPDTRSSPPGVPATTDLRVLDAAGQVVAQPVLVRLPDGVSVWMVPDADGWIRINDSAPGVIRVTESTDES